MEIDEVYFDQDVAVLTPATRLLRQQTAFAFHHLPAHAEPLLWISDGVAWCDARGGPWRTAVANVIDAVIET